jgi:hypothetical protein
MRAGISLLPVAMLWAMPAAATQTMVCDSKEKGAPSVGLAIGHAAEPGVASAYFEAGGQEIKVAVSQSWLDDDKVWVNLGDPDLMELLVKLRASGPPGNIKGTLTYKGKTWKIRCSGEE